MSHINYNLQKTSIAYPIFCAIISYNLLTNLINVII